jgi:hypothetical protein
MHIDAGASKEHQSHSEDACVKITTEPKLVAAEHDRLQNVTVLLQNVTVLQVVTVLQNGCNYIKFIKDKCMRENEKVKRKFVPMCRRLFKGRVECLGWDMTQFELSRDAWLRSV